MLETYKAKLNGDHLIWQDDMPEGLAGSGPVDVIVTLVEPIGKKKRRPYGLAKGDFTVPDDFDDPLPKEIIASFEGR